MLTLESLKRLSLDNRFKNGENLRFRYCFPVNLVQVLAVVSTTRKHGIRSRCFAHKGNLCGDVERRFRE
jgi:hypothetical protein